MKKMEKITALLLALLMLLSTVSFAAPVMTDTVTSTSEEEAQISAENDIDTVQPQSETDWIDEQYGHLLYSIDFETENAFVTEQHPSKQGYVNPDFAEDTWTLVASSSTGISTDAGYKPAKVTENGNTFLRMYSNLATNMSFQVRTNGTSDGFFTDENGYYTVFADVKAIISGNAGQNYNQFFAQAIFPASSLWTAQTAETGKWTTASGMVYKTNEPALRRISYHFGYAGKTTTKNVDVFEIDNIKLYFKPFSKDVTVAGNAQLGIADKTVTVNIGEDLDSTITKEELMAMLSYEGDTVIKDLTLADGSAFTSIDVVEVQNVKGIFEKVEWLDDTYGYLLYDIDFETDTAYTAKQHPSEQGIVNPAYSDSAWSITTAGTSTEEGFTPVKVTENGNTFLRMYNGASQYPQFQTISGNAAKSGQFTDENGYYTLFADVRANVSGKAEYGFSSYYMQALFANGETTKSKNTKSITPDATSFTTDIGTVYYSEYDALRKINYAFAYKGKVTTSSLDVFDIDNIKLYFKPFSVDVKVDDVTVQVAIPETLGSNITKASLMELVPEKEDAVLTDLTLADGSEFAEIDVMKVQELAGVWLTKTPSSYDVAAIRTANPAGIRFKASVAKKFKTENAEYGFLVTREVLLGEQDADTALRFGNEENLNFVVGVNYGYDEKADKKVDRIFDEDSYSYIFTAAVTGVPETEAGYNDKLVVRPYLKDENGEYFYGEPVTRSVLDTAKALKEAGYAGLDENGIAFVQGILTACGEAV